jgi:hypothetical protein
LTEQHWSVIAAAVPNAQAATGSYNWTVAGPTMAKARIRVSWTQNPAVNDRSDVNSSIK